MTLSGRQAWRLLAVAAVVTAAWLGFAGGAAAAEKLKVAAVFETPIEEPWVNQIHVALLRAEKEFGIEYVWSEHVKAADFARVAFARRCVAAAILGDKSDPDQRRYRGRSPRVAYFVPYKRSPASPRPGTM